MYENWKVVQQLEHDAQQDYLQRRVELQRQLIHAVGKLEQERKKHDEERRHRVSTPCTNSTTSQITQPQPPHAIHP